MRKFLICLLSCLTVFASLAFVGCNAEFTVTFDGDGGTLVSGKEVQTVTSASKIKPPNYEKEGYEFDGWSVLLDDIKEDTTIKAKWKMRYSVVFSNAPRNNKKTDRTVIIGDEYKGVKISLDETLGDKLPAGIVTNPEDYKFKKWVVYINGKTIEIKKDTVFNEELLEGLTGTEITIYPELQSLWIGPY